MAENGMRAHKYMHLLPSRKLNKMRCHITIRVFIIAVPEQESEYVWWEVQQAASLLCKHITDHLIALIYRKHAPRAEVRFHHDLEQLSITVRYHWKWWIQHGYLTASHLHNVQPILHPLVALTLEELLSQHNIKVAAKNTPQHACLRVRFDLSFLT
mmetsp:Transcript_47633/g.84151  ORF Transcript_47633/g.84151 Transcript_47633/m.84151 type:complete len:156 (-) Transcript_47633:29-496(-)